MQETAKRPRRKAGRPWASWIFEVLRDWRWRHSAVALLLALLSLIYWHNFFFPDSDGQLHLLRWGFYYACQFAFPLVFALRLADRAADDGVSQVLAYGIATALALCLGSSVRYGIVQPLMGDATPWTIAGVVTRLLGWYVPTCIGIVAYVKWRQREQILARLRLSEIQHARQRQELQSAHLMALQARVEPTLLFETLQRIDALIESSTAAADTLLADTIEMLRAMLPQTGASTSTVEREFTLVQAYARVTGVAALQPPMLLLEAAPGAASASLAPMVLLPLLRSLTAHPSLAWRVRAEQVANRLHLTCNIQAENSAAQAALRSVDEGALRARLAAVHGAEANVRIELDKKPGIAIELPYRHLTVPHPFLQEKTA